MEKAPYSSGVGKDVDEETFSFAALDPSTKIKITASSQEPAEDPDSASGGLSPADIFFFKGQLQPHPYPFPTANNPRSYSDLNRSGSYTTSVSKSESLASSRGDSISSSSSSSRSGSSSRQNSAKRQLAGQVSSHPGVPLQQLLSSPAITPTVVSRSKRNPESSVAQGINIRGNASGVKKEKESQGKKSWWVGRKIVSACRECRALKPEKLPAIPRSR